MSGEYDADITVGIENLQEIQLADQETTLRKSSQSKAVTSKDVIWLTEDKELLDEIRDLQRNTSSSRHHDKIKIQKVPEIMLRNGDLKEYFTPMELSIGPIYAADPNLFKRELKLKLAAYFIKDQTEKTGEDFLAEIKNDILGIKTCFDAEVIESYSDEELIRMLFLDGCAMLGFIVAYMNQNLSAFNISNGQASLIQQDLFLLENQIPFRVLKVLMGTDADQEYLLRFICMSNIIAPNDSRNATDKMLLQGEVCLTNEKPVHLLDLNRRMLLPHNDSVSRTSRTKLCIRNFLERLALCCIMVLCAFPIICCYLRAKRMKKSQVCFGRIYQGKKQSFRNVQELKTAGIKFKPSDSLTAISFHSQFSITGWLKLPTLAVDDSTTRKLLNLVAYEMCMSSSDQDFKYSWVTSYINLLDLLIDNEQDVKDLRAVDIIRNCLSSDIEVAQLINTIGSQCFTPPEDTYKDVKDKIEKHYKRRCAIWMAKVCQSHFSSPWTILALFAAAVVLALTAIQTWFAVHPRN